ncbi:MAG: VWA domain-containing protein [Chloroflexi bacterium]|nr:VWA domain-containing protein [Chloroflexota bacterium]
MVTSFPSVKMTKYRYSQWDGTQRVFESDADELLNELERELMANGDLDKALQMLQLMNPPIPEDSQLSEEALQDSQQPLPDLEAARLAEAERLREITRILEEAGYIRLKDDGTWELTSRGMRKIGHKVLAEMFADIKLDRKKSRNVNLKSIQRERTGETRKFEFGDDLELHVQKTLMNAIGRQAGTRPIKLAVEDFEVYCDEAVPRSATVLMLDLSLSMSRRGNFQAAKRVTVALDSLIRSQYPRDSLHVIGFSNEARLIKNDALICMDSDEFEPYTNIQQGLRLAYKILSQERGTNKQIIMITDGEPTAHLEGGKFFSQFPPSDRTLELTLKEAIACTRNGIIINTFMLESGRFLGHFVHQMTRINKGKIFLTSADNIGQYLLVDYISNKTKKKFE